MQRREQECLISKITEEGMVSYWQRELQAKRQSNKVENTGMSKHRENKSGKTEKTTVSLSQGL
jgi:hypothetical protein